MGVTETDERAATAAAVAQMDARAHGAVLAASRPRVHDIEDAFSYMRTGAEAMAAVVAKHFDQRLGRRDEAAVVRAVAEEWLEWFDTLYGFAPERRPHVPDAPSTG